MTTAAEQISADVRCLCDPGDRDLGTQRNRAAVAYVGERMRELGLAVEELPFEVPEWRFGAARVRAGGLELEMHPGPFSGSVDASGPLLVVRSWDDLAGLEARGRVLLVCDAAAREPLTPRGYPFYANPQHAAIADALEAAEPLAIIAATTSHQMAGGMSPFPLIEEQGFRVPTGYLLAEQGARLASHAGEIVSVAVDSETASSDGVQLVAHRPGRDDTTGAGTIVVSAHIDSKPETPGAIDNAGGVAVLLAVASLLRGQELTCDVEFVPFNGEDHSLAPGELAYLAARSGFEGVRLNINVDGAGLRGGPSAYSCYGVSEEFADTLARIAAPHAETIVEGPSWPASDHMIFAMRGVPAIAITSSDFGTFSSAYSHTPADVPEILDPELLAETARFIAAIIEAKRPDPSPDSSPTSTPTSTRPRATR